MYFPVCALLMYLFLNVFFVFIVFLYHAKVYIQNNEKQNLKKYVVATKEMKQLTAFEI